MDINKENVLNTSTRKLYIDELRGVAMIIVVYGHCLLSKSSDYSVYFVFSSPLNVALFFVISGFLFKTRDGDQRSFYKYLFFRLFIPWIALGLFPYYNIARKLPLLISGETLWFMPALIIGEIVWFYIRSFVRKKRNVILVGLTISFLGLLFFHFDFLNYAMINRALTIQWLFVLGFCLKEKENVVLNTTYFKKYILLALVLYVTLCMCFLQIYPDQFYDVHMNRYFFIPLTWSIISLGILLSFSFFANLKYVSKVLVLIGQNTLLIYMIHGLGRVAFSKILGIFSITYSTYYYPYIAVLETCFACSICLVLSLIANKYFPLIVGRQKIKL